MWTYQEILLASNPILVLGNMQLQWSAIERGIIFLQYSGVCGRLQPRLNSVLGSWTELVLGRDSLQSSQAAPRDNSLPSRFQLPHVQNIRATPLMRYRDSVIDVAEVANNIKRFFWRLFLVSSSFAALTAYVELFGIWTDFNYSHPVDESLHALLVASDKTMGSLTACLQACRDVTTPTCIHTCKSADLGLEDLEHAQDILQSARGTCHREVWLFAMPVVFSLLVLVSISSKCCLRYLAKRATGPVYPPRDTTLNLVKSLCTRKCTEVKDKAFAVHAVLQCLSKLKLRLPDATRSLVEIHTELSTNIIEVTGSLALLIPAAASHFDDGPSWAPDWSAAIDPIWASQPLYLGHPADATPGSQSVFNWDNTHKTVLTVSGIFRYGKVRQVYRLRETSETYQPEESAKHLTNLRTMTSFLRYIAESRRSDFDNQISILLGTDESRTKWFEARYITNMLTMLSENDNYGLERLKSEDVKAWAGHLMRFKHSEPALLLSFLKLRATALKTHIAVCNALARGRKVFFCTSLQLHANSYREDPRQRAHHRGRIANEGQSRSKNRKNNTNYVLIDFGIACDTIKPGDNLALISGVRMPLLLRTTSETSKLVSPAVAPHLMTGRGWDDALKQQDLAKIHLA